MYTIHIFHLVCIKNVVASYANGTTLHTIASHYILDAKWLATNRNENIHIFSFLFLSLRFADFRSVRSCARFNFNAIKLFHSTRETYCVGVNSGYDCFQLPHIYIFDADMQFLHFALAICEHFTIAKLPFSCSSTVWFEFGNSLFIFAKREYIFSVFIYSRHTHAQRMRFD